MIDTEIRRRITLAKETASERLKHELTHDGGRSIISANTGCCKKQTLSKMGFMSSLNDF